MSKVQTSQVEVSKNRVKKRKGRGKSTFCILCRRFHPKHAAQEHMHSMLHHKELETLLGANSVHDCQACQTSSTSLQEYAQHISTTQHKIRFKYLVASNVKPISLYRTLSPEIINQICVRNKTLKKEEKKKEKKKKKQKQINAQKRAEKQQATNTNLERLNQVNAWTWEQMQESCQTGSNNAGNFVFQNKENKGSSLHRPPHYREPPLQNQYGKFAGVSGEVDTRTWHQVSVQDHFVHSAQQMTHEDSVSVNNQCSNVTAQHNWQYSGNSAIDFTSDYLSPSGALIFDSNHNGNTGPTQSQQGDQYCSTNSVNPANRSVSTAAKGDVNVNTMLKQIRRALGMREPCRADREAKKQNSDAGVTYHNTLQQTGPEKGYMLCEASTSVQLPQINTPAPVAPAAVCFSNITATAKQKQTTFRMPQKMPQHCEKVTDELSNSRERESQGALHSNTLLSKCTAKTTSTEPNVNINHKVRIAHKPGRAHWAKDAKLKPTINKLLALSGAKGRLSWMGMYNEMKRKRQKEVKGMPRFGIKFVNPLTSQERLTQPQDFDSPLSEGFHWESIPGSPSVPLLTSPPPPQDTTNSNSHREVPSSSHIPEPATSQQSGSSHTETTTLLKMEPNLQNEDGCLKDNDRANKRKANMDGNVSNKERVECGKKKRTKSKKNQNRMDELLAVSLKEDELSHSLQDLDQSLVQARNALQAAYAEVQRLVVLRQQFTAEVNSLRARRIEILQGMQEGYSGASNVTERATTSAGGAAASVQPRHSPLSSSSAFVTSPSQQTAATTSIPPLTQPHPAPLALSAVPLQQEICQPATAVQLVLPPKLFPPLLLPPSHSAAPTATATTTKTVKNDHEEEAGGNLNEAAAETSVPERDQGTSEAVTVVIDDDVGNESDDSVKMMEPSDLVIIKVNESDNEDTPEPPQKSVNVDVSSASTQTTQHMKTERKPLHCLPVKDDSTPAEPVEDEEPSLGAFMNHTGPVHGLQVYDGLLYTCSGDNTARAYSLTNRECKAVFEGHTSKINCLLVSSLPNMTARLYTGSSDQTIRCYSIKSKKCLDQILLPDRVLCLHIAWNILYAGLANGSVASYDTKTLKQLDVFECHGPRGVSCLGTAQEGARRLLLVGSYDSTISVRDAKNSLLLRSLEGHTKTVLCMKVVNDLVFSGSSDTSVHAHNIHTGELIRIYKGHGHAVTSIVILGKVMVTACLDKLIRIYELQSHDRLQVYGGHSDMVMCMDIHKSVIYTGCYDGSIQAVKLNLMKNYRCWWQNCSLIFGMVEHLVQHLVGDHSNPNLQTTRCRWRGCNTFFATQEAVRQTLPEHMKSHVEKDSELQA